jgi:hypothetical protein
VTSYANLKYQNAELNNPVYENQQDTQCTYNVTLRSIRATVVALQSLEVLRKPILSKCL